MSDVTPKAQELADEKGVDLSEVKGSGKDGRVLVEDVEAHLEEDAPAEEPSDAISELVEANLDSDDELGDAPVIEEPAEEAPAEEVEATPAAEELAEEKGVDLSEVEGSGKEGRILVEDVKSADEEEDAGPPPGSTDYVRSRGLRERGFYVLPDEVNPRAAAAKAAAEAELAASGDDDDS